MKRTIFSLLVILSALPLLNGCSDQQTPVAYSTAEGKAASSPTTASNELAQLSDKAGGDTVGAPLAAGAPVAQAPAREALASMSRADSESELRRNMMKQMAPN